MEQDVSADYLGDVCCAENCGEYPLGLCETCPPNEAWPFCLNHLGEHVAMCQGHIVRIPNLEVLRGTLDEQIYALNDVEFAVDRLQDHAKALDALLANNAFIPSPEEKTTLSLISDRRNEVAALCCELHDSAHRLGTEDSNGSENSGA